VRCGGGVEGPNRGGARTGPRRRAGAGPGRGGACGGGGGRGRARVCVWSGVRARAVRSQFCGGPRALPSARSAGTRQRLHLCRVPALGKELPRGRLWGHQGGWILPSAMWPALGKRPLCRVPALALGKKYYFFCFGRQFFCEAFLQYHDQHVQIWHIFSTFCYIFHFISIC